MEKEQDIEREIKLFEEYFEVSKFYYTSIAVIFFLSYFMKLRLLYVKQMTYPLSLATAHSFIKAI